MELKDTWDVDSAMQILQHQTVDAKLWAEAVEWLILYGPDEIRGNTSQFIWHSNP